MRAPALIAALAAAIALPVAAQPLTLSAAVDEALSRNPNAVAASAGIDVARAQLREAQSGWLPRIDATEQLTRSNNPVFVFGSLLEQGRFGPQNFDVAFLNDPPPLQNARFNLNVRYAIFDQLRRLDAVRQARHGVDAAVSMNGEARQRIRFEVLSRFYGVAVAQQHVAVAREAVRSAEADAAAMRDRFQQGLLVESDLLATEVQLASFRQQLVVAEGDAAIAVAALNAVLHRPPAQPTEVAATLSDRTFEPLSLDEAIRGGLASRGEIRGAQAASAGAQLQLQTARGSLLPRVDAFASWGASGRTISDHNGDHTAGLVVSLDLFDGGKYARIAQAKAAAVAAKASEDSARDAISMEIVAAWYHARSASERVAVASQAVGQAESAARIVHDRYQQGLTTITENLRAQTALVAARLNLIAARYDALVAHADLLRATGGLHDVSPFS